MKRRRGFRQICVDGTSYSYKVSLLTRKLITYNNDSGRHETKLPERFGSIDFSQSWRRKQTGNWSSQDVSDLIRRQLWATSL